jgi:hypothetical protein
MVGRCCHRWRMKHATNRRPQRRSRLGPQRSVGPQETHFWRDTTARAAHVSNVSRASWTELARFPHPVALNLRSPTPSFIPSHLIHLPFITHSLKHGNIMVCENGSHHLTVCTSALQPGTRRPCFNRQIGIRHGSQPRRNTYCVSIRPEYEYLLPRSIA